MELALYLGGTAEELARRMSLREFSQWRRFSMRRMMPLQRVEILLASLVSIKTQKPIGDILVRPLDAVDGVFDPTSVMDTAFSLADIAGTNVHVLGLKKKQRKAAA